MINELECILRQNDSFKNYRTETSPTLEVDKNKAQ